MKFNKWTLALASLGVVSLGSVAQAADNAVQTALGSTTISGYVDTSIIWRPGNQSSGAAGAGPRGFGAAGLRSFDGNTKQDGFNLNVVKLSLEKPLDDAQWSAGYKVDLLFGPDAVGYNAAIGGGGDLGIKQAYVALRAPVGNGLDFKVGTFDTIIGYESYEAGNNPNYGRSYGWSIEPTAHTGVLMSYKFADWISATAGIANTTASGINAGAARPGSVVSESEKTYMGAIALTAPESWGSMAGSTLYAGIVNGLGNGTAAPGLAINGLNDTTWIYVGSTLNTPIKGLTFGAAYDQVLTTSDAAGTSGAHAYTIAGYSSFQATEKLKLNTRVDYAKGTVGTWYGVAATEVNPKNNLISITETVDYALWANVISRLEVRYDHDLTGQKNGAGPFGFDDNNAWSVALNLIYKF